MEEQKDNHAGNALLELVLFVPLLMLILLAGLDAGLAYAEKTAISSALRAGINGQRNLDLPAPARPGFDYLLSPDAERTVLEQVAESIETDLLRVRGRGSDPAADPYRVRASLVQIEFDSETGRVVDCRVVGTAERGDSAFEPGEQELGARYVDAGEYISQACAAGSEASDLAPPPAVRLPLDGSNGSIDRQSRAYQIYGEINAAVRGLNRNLTRSLLNRGFSVREQALVVLRLSGGQR